MAKRDHISLETKLAAAICELLAIPHEHAKLMTADQVLSLVQWDHYPILRDDGLKLGMSVAEVDGHANLVPRTIMAHREKTATIDVPQIAKTKRLQANDAVFRAAMASKAGDYVGAAQILATAPKLPRTKKKIQSRPFATGHRPLRSNSTFARRAP